MYGSANAPYDFRCAECAETGSLLQKHTKPYTLKPQSPKRLLSAAKQKLHV